MPSFTILEPMSTGDVIDRAVRVYRRNFTPLVAIVAIPTVLGYVSSLIFWAGYSQLLGQVESPSPQGVPAGAFLLMALGGLGYPVWFFVLLVTVSGLSRVIGDHLMLGEAITFRKCVGAVRKRLGDITLMTLLSFAIIMVLYIALMIVMFALLMIIAFMTMITASAGLPPWLLGTIMVIASLTGVAAGVVTILIVLSRVIFIPQIIMIEGQSAGSALGRAFSLGSRNWHRLGAIVLFSYFVTLSLVAALGIPSGLFLYMTGLLNADFLASPAGTAIYSAFEQIARLLVLPIWVISITLLYFDNRVRKEAYDLDLLAHELAPGFYWQPAAPGFQVPPSPGSGRVYVQTSPLGLADYRARGSQAVVAGGIASGPVAGPGSVLRCKRCAAELEPGALFCIRCGSRTET